MPNAILWQAAPTSRSTVLTTELNSLANAAFSGVGTEIDNSSNLDQWGCLDITLASLNPTTGAYIQLFLSQCPDGTNYGAPPSSTNPAFQDSVAYISVPTGSAAKRLVTPWFRLPPCKFKVVLLNGTNVSLASSGNSVTLYTNNDEVQ